MNEKTEYNISRMAGILKTRKNAKNSPTVLFLGSRTGSLFRRSSLWDLLIQATKRTLLDLTPVERFRECKKMLLDDLEVVDRDAFIGKALEEKYVGVADICVAELVKQGIFDLIITTNIGSELEHAFLQCNLLERRDFNVFIPTDRIYVSRSHLFTMVKVSGDFDARKYDITSKADYLESYPGLKRFIEDLQGWNMLMVGFDHVWDRHVASAFFTRKGGDLWYVNEEQTEKESSLLLRLKESEAKRLEGVEGSYEIFFMNLCWHTLGSIPTYQLTLDKLNRMEKTLIEMQKKQYDIQEAGYALQQGLGSLSTKVDKIIKQLAISPPLADSTSSLHTDAIAAPSSRRKQRQNKSVKESEEK